jgi:hypothetical protein
MDMDIYMNISEYIMIYLLMDIEMILMDIKQHFTP